MARMLKMCWMIVTPTVQIKVAHLWWNPEAAAEYLQDLSARYLASRQKLQRRAAQDSIKAEWISPTAEAHLDLARIYAVAAGCVKSATYDEFAAAMNEVTVSQLARRLAGEPPWTPEAHAQAQDLVLGLER